MSRLRFLAALSAALVCGCALYRGAKVTEGTDFSAGVSLPSTEGVAEVSVVNYLSGLRVGADRNYRLDCEFWGTNSISFAWGLYESGSGKHFKTKCIPVSTNAPNAQLVLLCEPAMNATMEPVAK